MAIRPAPARFGPPPIGAAESRAVPAVRPASDPRSTDEVAPGERAPERRRAGLLRSALVEFSRYGFGGARVDRIAARTNTNKAMLYQYFGSKEKLYVAVLEEAYTDIRRAEAAIDFDVLSPTAALERLIAFTFDYYVAHPDFVQMIGVENQHGAIYLKTSRTIADLNTSIIKTLERILTRGDAAGVFRPGLDATGLYISISALGFTYVANRHTLETVFGRPLMDAAALDAHRATMHDMVLGYVEPRPRAPDTTHLSSSARSKNQ